MTSLPSAVSRARVQPVQKGSVTDAITLLNDGRVLYVAGWDSSPGAEIYDPSTNSFTPSDPTPYPLYDGTAKLLGNGLVLIAGGRNLGWWIQSQAAIWDPLTGLITQIADMTTQRARHTATTLKNGEILITGGVSGYLGDPYVNSSAELYTPTYVPITIDIKPGGYPNTFNQNAHGVIPVAILGSSTLNVQDVNIATLWLQGLSVKVAGKSGNYLPHCEDVNADGYQDLVVQFQDSDDWIVSGDGSATLTGKLLNGTEIRGEDAIQIVP